MFNTAIEIIISILFTLVFIILRGIEYMILILILFPYEIMKLIIKNIWYILFFYSLYLSYIYLSYFLIFAEDIYNALMMYAKNIITGNTDFIQKEIESGIFALRLSTIVIYSGAAIYTYKLITSLLINKHCQRNDYLSYFFVTTQYFVYLSCTIILWNEYEENKISTIFPLLSWAILFIADDWVIISGYIEKFKNNITPSHVIRIITFNFIITSLSLVDFFRQEYKGNDSHFETIHFLSIIMNAVASFFYMKTLESIDKYAIYIFIILAMITFASFYYSIENSYLALKDIIISSHILFYGAITLIIYYFFKKN